ncbi:hypothetical protein AVEN_57961-1 [Araneus ventricosus]|uniref:Uncharacterized protein n=1 Tax=Araneus ventricosus TaxID=182803 RepID=A0A4Y2X131_ARAVE|nr:hypothetical protein AVEN_57961-1 [Araneus ventricosus]
MLRSVRERPHLIICDFFIRGFVNGHIYTLPLRTTLNDLEGRISVADNSIEPDMLHQEVVGSGLPCSRKSWRSHQASVILMNKDKNCMQVV